MPTKRITGNDTYGRPQWLRELRNHNSKRNKKPMAQPKSITESAPFDRKAFNAGMKALDRQNAEFDALTHLAAEWENLKTVAVVDDDYPRARHRYESAMKTFIAALKANGRLPVSMITATKSQLKRITPL